MMKNTQGKVKGRQLQHQHQHQMQEQRNGRTGTGPHLHYSIPPPHTQNAIEIPPEMTMNTTETLRSDASLIHINKRGNLTNGYGYGGGGGGNTSESHKIEFTKTEGCTPATCACLCIAILFISIGATSGIYFSLGLYEGTMIKERVFKGQFIITRGESYNPKFENPNSDEFKETARLYQRKLDELYGQSHYGKIFKSSEVIALEKSPKPGSDDVIVHFNLHLMPQNKPRIDVTDLYIILGDEVLNSKKRVFQNISIDSDSISLQERRPLAPKRGLFHSSAVTFPASKYFSPPPDPWEPRIKFPGLLEGLRTDPTPPPRKCLKIAIPFCKVLPYNYTSYPNVVGHWNTSSLEEDFIAFRQIVDSECYPQARQFLCSILQPECSQDELLWPCRSFCVDFMKSCEHFISKQIAKKIKCKEFPNWPSEVRSSSPSSSSSSSSTSSFSSLGTSVDKQSPRVYSVLNDAMRSSTTVNNNNDNYYNNNEDKHKKVKSPVCRRLEDFPS